MHQNAGIKGYTLCRKSLSRFIPLGHGMYRFLGSVNPVLAINNTFNKTELIFLHLCNSSVMYNLIFTCKLEGATALR